MKKICVSILTALLGLSLVSCNKTTSNGEKPGESVPPVVDDNKPTVPEETPNVPETPEKPEEEKVDYKITEEEFKAFNLLNEPMFKVEAERKVKNEFKSATLVDNVSYKNKSLYVDSVSTSLENGKEDVSYQTIYTLYNENKTYDEYVSLDKSGFDNKDEYNKIEDTFGYKNFNNFLVFQFINYSDLKFNKESNCYTLNNVIVDNEKTKIEEGKLQFIDNKIVSLNLKFEKNNENRIINVKYSYDNVEDIKAPQLNNYEITKEILDSIKLHELNNFTMNYKVINTDGDITTTTEYTTVSKLDNDVYGKVDSPNMQLNSICKLKENDMCDCYVFGNSYDQLISKEELNYLESPFYIYLDVVDKLLREDFSKFIYNKEGKCYEVKDFPYNVMGNNGTFTGNITFKNNRLYKVEGKTKDQSINVRFSYDNVNRVEILPYQKIDEEIFKNFMPLSDSELSIEVTINRTLYYITKKDNIFKVENEQKEAIYYLKSKDGQHSEYRLVDGKFEKNEVTLNDNLLVKLYLRQLFQFQMLKFKDVSIVDESLMVYRGAKYEEVLFGFKDEKLSFLSDSFYGNKMFFKYEPVKDIVLPNV